MTVTSIAIVPLSHGDRPEDVGTSASSLMQGRISDILKSPGAQRCYWGRAVEHPDLLYLLVDWDTLQHHVNFTNNPRDDATDLSPLFAGTPVIYHAELTPEPAPGILTKPQSPVTEVATIYFPVDLPELTQEKVVSDTKKFRAILDTPDGCIASSGGWVLEEVEIPGQDKKGKAFIMMFGWESIEAHNSFVKTPKVQEHVHLIAGLGGLISLDMCHVAFTEISR
ncbi:uncharacterized protein A1O9_06248 [Exophiala aquamarina CBS 119918]|uniref:ABM domain-containing protein n=1 Tax=Exophiala aquamarina CBS 119918 TaxID=1182545 RepID=A0A072PF10_9EURO|nr:uncharacterized protein A1O9_06248 [Exophiala aquamarina CBS 119918]KEF58322.1 hypothetical protein A1O9_06248 [Exophiala aquamarina CBS 119918]